MNLFSMNQVTTYRWSFEEDVCQYAAAGYEGIGVWRRKLADFGEERALELLAESGLQVSNLTWAGGFTGADGRSYNEAISDAETAVQLCAELNAGCLVVCPGGRNGHTHRHTERLLRSALDHLLSLAVDANVVLAIKPMHPACAGNWTFLTDISTTFELIESFATDRLKIVLDTYHFGHDQTVVDYLPEIVPHIGVVHLADRRLPHSIDQERCPLGDGCLPLRNIVQALIEANYVGDFDIELFGREIELSDYDDLIASSKLAIDHLRNEAVGAS